MFFWRWPLFMSHNKVHSDLVCPIKSQYMFPLLFFSAWVCRWPQAHCAVFGLGGVGRPVIMGCKVKWSNHDSAVDTNKDNTWRQSSGCHWVHQPTGPEKPIQEVLFDLTGDGVDFSFEVIGNPETVVCDFQLWKLPIFLSVVFFFFFLRFVYLLAVVGLRCCT